MPKISVIMPVYNTEESFLRKAIESVLNQTFEDFELIIVNDGSTDNSAQIINEYAVKHKHIKVITNAANEGLSTSRNSGIAIAQGNFIAFLDSDDFYASNFLEIMLKAAEHFNAEVVGCDFKKIYSDNSSLKSVYNVLPKVYSNPLAILLHKNNFIHFNVWNKIYKKEIFTNLLFVPDIYFEDWVFNSCAFAKISSFIWIKDALYGYRLTQNSIMRGNFNSKKLDDYIRGIEIVAEFYKHNYPTLWKQVKKIRVARTVKMLMNNTIKSKDKLLFIRAKRHLQRLYQHHLIGYQGLSFCNKVKLYRFLMRA